MATIVASLGVAFAARAQSPRQDNELRRLMPAVEYTLIATSEYRDFIRNNPISGFARMRGTVNRGDKVTIREFVDLQPSGVDAQLAMIMAQQARVNALHTGSAMPPSVDVYVVFYNQDKPDKLALVFAIQGTSVHHVERSINRIFITLVQYQIAPKTKPGSMPASSI